MTRKSSAAARVRAMAPARRPGIPYTEALAMLERIERKYQTPRIERRTLEARVMLECQEHWATISNGRLETLVLRLFGGFTRIAIDPAATTPAAVDAELRALEGFIMALRETLTGRAPRRHGEGNR
jgi:hypothetical protein